MAGADEVTAGALADTLTGALAAALAVTPSCADADIGSKHVATAMPVATMKPSLDTRGEALLGEESGRAADFMGDKGSLCLTQRFYNACFG